ncbi:MAG: hypothetical protein WBG92_08220, partial [Thiohalocapsa sp.]
MPAASLRVRAGAGAADAVHRFLGFEHLAGSATSASVMQELRSPATPVKIQPKATNPTAKNMASRANLKSSGREAALARRHAMSNIGKRGVGSSSTERIRDGGVSRPAAAPASERATAAPERAPVPTRAELS